MQKKSVFIFSIIMLLNLTFTSAFDFEGNDVTLRIVEGNLTNLSEMQDVNIPSPNNNEVLTWSSSLKVWISQSIAAASSLWTQVGNDIFYTNGSVGIGTPIPNASLQVEGNSKFGDEENYTELENNGFLFLKGSARAFTDIDIFLTEKSGAGIVSPDFIKFKDDGAGSTGVFNFAFDNNAEEELFFNAKVPHHYAEGTDTEFHIHWSPSTNNSGNVVWGVEYTWVEKNGIASDTIIEEAAIPTSEEAFKHKVNDIIPYINGTGKGIGGEITGRLFRNAAHVNDTYPDDAFLLAADFHILTDGFGTREEGSKF